MASIPRSTLLQLTGPVLVGSIINWMLLGTLGLQAYTYYSSSAERKERATQVLVTFILLADLAQTGASTDYAWRILVDSWGNQAIFAALPGSVVSLTCINPLISVCVQTYFAWRIWRLLANMPWFRPVAVLIALIALMQLSAGIALTILFARTLDPFVASQDPVILGLTKAHFSGNFAVDILIAITTWFILQKAKTKSNVKATNNMLTRLTILAIQTGSITAIGAGLDLLFILISPTTNTHQVFAFILGKLYSNTLLANLNARTAIGRSRAGGSVWLSDSKISSGSGTGSGVAPPSENVRLHDMEHGQAGRPKPQSFNQTRSGVTIQTEVVRHRDSYEDDLYNSNYVKSRPL